ncbi:MAG TPA: hypothetical protein VLZ07_03530 [Syntrophales bacterium]|nr:hypothetical protein [Syntrophales bacterium]
MATLKEGDYLKCDVCDLVVVVDEECGCIEGGLICCDEEMVKVKRPAKAKAKPAAKAKKAAAKKTAKKKAKPKKK